MQNKKILIIGAFGFMGKNVVKAFEDSSYEIFKESRKTGLDLSDLASVEKKLLLIKPDIIINCAAHVGGLSYVMKYGADIFHDNCLMYLNLYKAVNNINKNILIINPISNCSYPEIVDIQKEENFWDGKLHDSVESYGMTKKVGFVLSESYKKQYNIKTINLIIPNAYGPEDYLDAEKTHAMNGIIFRMLNDIKNNKKTFKIWGSGNPIREWIYMPDVARIIKIIIDKKMFDIPNPINLGQEFGISIKDVTYIIKDKLNSQISIEYDLSKSDGAPKKIMSKYLFSSIFPNFEFTKYENAIEETIKYYKKMI